MVYVTVGGLCRGWLVSISMGVLLLLNKKKKQSIQYYRYSYVENIKKCFDKFMVIINCNQMA